MVGALGEGFGAPESWQFAKGYPGWTSGSPSLTISQPGWDADGEGGKGVVSSSGPQNHL